ncbi:hypothetical protein ACJH6J_24015 [Mycobacterium sp. SMC-18]|uniref:hypothetical protein n=1 Tax=unclassified Mycobacterium TaxID=2642494 RepID=UPI0038777D0D
MGWEYAPGGRSGEWHEGYLVAEFDDGQRAFGLFGIGIPAGHLAVDQYGDGTWGEEAVRRHGGRPEFQTRPAGEVIGWRVTCNCYQSGSEAPDHRWFSRQLWTRVPSPTRHDPKAFRIYAADEDVLDVISGDANPAAHDVWWRDHISELDAAMAIRVAAEAVRAGEEQLDRAVASARRQNLTWAKIGAAAGMTGQAAHARWSKRMIPAGLTEPAQGTIGQFLAADPGLPSRFNPNLAVCVDGEGVPPAFRSGHHSGADDSLPSVTAESLASELRSRGWVARESGTEEDTEQVCEIDEDDHGQGVDVNVYFLRYEPATWIVGANTHHAPTPSTVAELADRIIATISEDAR